MDTGKLVADGGTAMVYMVTVEFISSAIPTCMLYMTVLTATHVLTTRMYHGPTAKSVLTSTNNSAFDMNGFEFYVTSELYIQ